MNGPHFFSVINDAPRNWKTRARKRDRIARSIDATAGYVYYQDCGTRTHTAYGYVQNRGEPFDRAVAREIEAAWVAAGV